MSISALSEQCEVFIRRLVSAASTSEERTLLADHLFRFNIWVKSHVAPSDRRDSLDCRLRKAVVSHSLIQELLTALLEALNRNSSFIEPTGRTISSDENPQSVGDASSDEDPESVEDILDQLFWYTQVLYQSGILRSLVEVPIHFEYDEITGENLTVKFQDTILPYLNATLKDATQEMRERLSRTIFLRQQNLSFLSSISSRKVASRPIMDSALESTGFATQASSKLRIAYSPQSCDSTQICLQADWIRTHGTRTAPSVQTATAVDSNQLPQVNTILEQKNAHSMAANLPRRPKVPAGQTEFECPYCFVVCPAQEYTEENWPRHIIKDLAPFICVQESCLTPDTMYESHADWISHMETEHTRQGWACRYVTHDSIQYFEDISSLRRHLTEHSGDGLTNDEWNDLTENCRCPLPFQPFKSCPFCSEYTDDASIDLGEHITLHLLYLSQVSIQGDFIELQGVELESEPEKSSSGTRLKRGKLSHKICLSSISSFRTPESGTSASSSINDPKVVNADVYPVAPLPKLEHLAKKRKGKDQDDTDVQAISESSANNSSGVGQEMPSCLRYCSISPNMGLFDDIIDIPPIEHTPDQPDIWDRLEVRERLQDQGKQSNTNYDAEMDSTLWGFRLRYILELRIEDTGSSWLDEAAVVKSCLQLADALDAHGRYSEVKEILMKLLSDKETVLMAIS
ncbi:hypothetical protein MKX08_007373 [Trichoderma sp. CBMAI-0020]|nr:hypothetical protein MKX08_007373 [Trichoderma sp. CBMAI-0020]